MYAVYTAWRLLPWGVEEVTFSKGVDSMDTLSSFRGRGGRSGPWRACPASTWRGHARDFAKCDRGGGKGADLISDSPACDSPALP